MGIFEDISVQMKDAMKSGDKGKYVLLALFLNEGRSKIFLFFFLNNSEIAEVK